MPPKGSIHSQFHYSVKSRTHDSAVLHCLRALCQWAQEDSNVRVGWGGTKLADWKKAGNCVTFRFTTTGFRAKFISKAKELLPDRWEVVETRDEDPATPQLGR